MLQCESTDGEVLCSAEAQEFKLNFCRSFNIDCLGTERIIKKTIFQAYAETCLIISTDICICIFIRKCTLYVMQLSMLSRIVLKIVFTVTQQKNKLETVPRKKPKK